MTVIIYNGPANPWQNIIFDIENTRTFTQRKMQLLHETLKARGYKQNISIHRVCQCLVTAQEIYTRRIKNTGTGMNRDSDCILTS